MRLTAKERVLLYLLEATPARDTVEASPALTQEAVARGASIKVRHVPQYVRPLIREGWVREWQAHVKGIRQRRKVVALTESGRRAATRLRDRVEKEVIRVRDRSGVREMTVSEALRAAGHGVSLLGVLRPSLETGIVDVAAVASAKPTGFVAMLSTAPRVDTFVGRRRELGMLTADGDGPRMFVVRGVAGIGKSWLAAKACEALLTKRNVYWRRIRPWDTSLSILAGLSDFLSALARPGLRSVLSRGETSRLAEVLQQDLPGTQSLLVFDDAHETSQEAMAAFRVIKEAIAEAADVRAILLTRRSLPFYDRRDAVLARLIREIDLDGLEPADAVVLLGVGEWDAHIAKVARRFGGHPLLLGLVRASEILPNGASLPSDVEQFIEEGIYRDLSEPERRMLKLAALYRIPVPRAAFFCGPDLTQDVLLQLLERALLRRVGDDTFEVHDTIHDYFESILTRSERTALGEFALNQLRARASRAESAADYAASVDCLSNGLQLAHAREDRMALLEGLGDA